MPVLEAMAAAVPVITAKRSALPEVAGDAALLVDPDCDEELESVLRLLADEAGLREELIRKGLMQAQRFSWHSAITSTLGVYRELLD
jgi:alpha-1,3-rhamnosyl/mannosyltransferase